MKTFINPNLFYSAHGLGDLNFHGFSSLLHIDDLYIFITQQYVLSVHPPGCAMQPQSQPIQNKVYQLFPKADTPGFFTMVTGTPAHPMKPNNWVPPRTPSSILPHDQVFMFLSLSISYTHNFFIIPWPLPLFCGKKISYAVLHLGVLA